MNKINEENKTIQTSIDYLKNMPIVKKLESELLEARMEIKRLRSLLDGETMELKTEEVKPYNTPNVSYDDITKLVSDEINEKNNDAMMGYLNNSQPKSILIDELAKFKARLEQSDDEKGATVESSEEEESGTNDDVVEEDAAEEEVTKNEAVEEDAAEEEVTKNEAVEEEVTEEEVTEEEVTEEEATEEEATEEEVTEEEAVEEEATEEESEEEEEVEEFLWDGVMYYTTDPENGILFKCEDDGDIGDEVGVLKNGKPFFS
jgi:hypothetical protein